MHPAFPIHSAPLPIRVKHDLRALLTEMEIADYTGRGLSIYDSAGALVLVVNAGSAICSPSEELTGKGQRDSCPILELPDLVEEGQWLVCGPNASRYLAPVRVHKKNIGFLGSAQVQRSDDLNTASQEPVVQGALEIVALAARRRRTKIEQDANRAIREAGSEWRIRGILHDVVGQLFGDVRDIYFLEQEGEIIKLKNAAGDAPQGMEFRRAGGWGFAGKVLRSGVPTYVKNLPLYDPRFVDEPGQQRPKSVYSMVTWWGKGYVPTIIQIQSLDIDAFPTKNDRRFLARLVMRAGRAAADLQFKAGIREALASRRESAPWRDQVLDLLLSNCNTVCDLISMERKIYGIFTEQLRVAGGPECIAASIRLVNPLSQDLAYVECRGDVWTPNARQFIYARSRSSAGGAALRTSQAIYYYDVEKQAEYEAIIPDTKSLWAKSFHDQCGTTGVCSVDWRIVDGGSPEIKARLELLVDEFASILNMIEAREEVLRRHVDETISTEGGLSDVIEDIAAAFDAQYASTYEDEKDRGFFVLRATTHPGKKGEIDKERYKSGKGITGWVAKHKCSLAIHCPENPEELKDIARRHRIDDPIQRRTLPLGQVTSGLGVLAAPMLVGARVIGVIRLGVPRDRFRTGDESFLQKIANWLGAAFYRARVEEARAEAMRDLERVAQSMEAREVIGGAAEVALNLIQQSSRLHGSFIRIDDKESETICVRARGSLQEIDKAISADVKFWVPLSEVLGDESLNQANTPRCEGGLMPLFTGDDSLKVTLGVCFRSTDDLGEFLKRESQWRDRILMEIRPAISLARSEKKLRTELAHTGRLRDIAQAYATASDMSILAKAVLQTVLEETKMTHGTVRLFERFTDSWHRIASTDDDLFPPNLKTNERFRACLRSRVALLVNTGHEHLPSYSNLPDDAYKDYIMNRKTLYAIPMWLKDTFLGAIFVSSFEEVPLDPTAEQHATILSQYAATAIHSMQARLSELELYEQFAKVGTLTGTLLHTMRNLLTQASGYWDNLYRMNDLSAPAKERLDKLGGELRKIGDACRHIASFTPDPPHELISVNDVLDRIWPLVLDHANINLEKLLDPSNPTIRGNTAQIEGAFKMLIQNAAEALPAVGSGGIRIVRLQTRVRNNCVVVKVADSGCGMDAQTRDNAFRPAFTTKTTGNGLGLAVVLDIAKRHKARIRVTSRQGWGTVIGLYFNSEGNDNG